ncbi:flavin monoamine oxidase family protein [Halobacillus faecis]|uniref:Amine oxidase n=1 Tax=Halobacillus faecis TaxID=360184 RepID=A0A511WN47_9BACI|nr:flavin monoamine oxidase family protein [Halobacillus faecis]GEN52566.1 amine oxidase [Halobacillus faecis]
MHRVYEESVKEYKSYILEGLPKSGHKKRILILGAGMAGLVAGSLLKKAGHDVVILEGNDRVGGRVHTVREPFSNGNYIDVGAMRIPKNHQYVQTYIDKFGLSTNPFINSKPNDLLMINGQKVFRSEYEQNPDQLHFHLLPHERGKTAKQLFLDAVQPFLHLYRSSSDQEKKKLEDQFSNFSMGEYLRNNPYGPSMSNHAVRMIKLVLGIEGFPEFSFLDILIDITFPIFNGQTEFVEIQGGNDRLPHAFLPELIDNIYFEQKVTKIVHNHDRVTVHTEDQRFSKPSCWSGDLLLTTIPFSAFQFIDVFPFGCLSLKKWQAIREVINVPAVKIGIEFKSRFWERYPVGNLISDLPIRFAYQASHHQGMPGPGILLASYTWGQNALLFNSLDQKEATKQVLENLARVYGNVVYEEYMQSVVYNWSQNPFSAGCFTLFTPGQSRDLEEVMPLPEGRIHFAGEQTSSYHGWIEGAIESGIRAAKEMNRR